jgi:hypothetical protein
VVVPVKQKKCRVCRAEYTPYSSLAVACSPGCAIQHHESKKIKAAKKADQDFKRETKRRKVAAKTRSEWYSDVQVEFNKYIRARDFDQPCVSCGKFEGEPIGGTMFDCGHFLGTGSHPELRFNEINAHKQHARCNRGAAKSGRNDKTVSQQYRINLINKIGLPLVEWLEGPHKPLKATIDELRWLQGYYRQRAKEARAHHVEL